MNRSQIVRLTEQGERALKGAGGLTLVERRLLSRIDGQRTIEDLDRTMRSGELRPTLRHLLQKGFIALSGGAEGETADDEGGPGGLNGTQPLIAHFGEFVRLRDEVIEWLLARESAACNVVAEQVGAASTPRALRRILRDVEPMLVEAIGIIPAKDFLYRFGRRALKLS